MVISVAAGYYIGISTGKQKDFEWRELSIGSTGKGYGYTSEALFNSDIALPNIKKISGRSKLLHPDQAKKNALHLGYIVSVEVDKLDLEKVPSKYKEERKETYNAGDFTFDPIEEVVYRVVFKFTLKDKDGFELVKLEGPKHFLSSGKTNQFQDKVNKPVSATIVERIRTVVLDISVEECETCK